MGIGEAGQGTARLGKAGSGMAGRGVARHGGAGQGRARLGAAGQGWAGPGPAGRGEARLMWYDDDHYGYPTDHKSDPEDVDIWFPSYCEWSLLRGIEPMDIRAAFPSKYLRASDLQGREHEVQIESVLLESVNTGEEPKPVVHFVGRAKGLVLNVTNSYAIEELYGPETDNWLGKSVTLYPTTTQFQGRPVQAIRIKLPPMPEVDPSGDEIPF